jgi:hypothetical protein
MAENTPNPPGGALPPRPAEAAKVQPKKETVRINLPPKPTSAPTIKLPTLAPGGAPTAAAHAAPVAATAAPAPAVSAPKMPTPPPPSAAPAPRVAAPTAAPRPVAAAPQRPASAPALNGVDKGLAIASGVVSLLAAGAAAYLAFFLYTPPVP